MTCLYSPLHYLLQTTLNYNFELFDSLNLQDDFNLTGLMTTYHSTPANLYIFLGGSLQLHFIQSLYIEHLDYLHEHFNKADPIFSTVYTIPHYGIPQHISALERIQYRASKYIYIYSEQLHFWLQTTIYQIQLVTINVRLWYPVLYSMKNPFDNFDIQTFIKFCHHSTRSSFYQRNFTSTDYLELFNSLPTIDSVLTKAKFS